MLFSISLFEESTKEISTSGSVTSKEQGIHRQSVSAPPSVAILPISTALPLVLSRV